MSESNINNINMNNIPNKDDCLNRLETFFKCCSVNHQFGKIYRDSQFDNCNLEISQFRNCIMAKTVSDEKKREVNCIFILCMCYIVIIFIYLCIYLYYRNI